MAPGAFVWPEPRRIDHLLSAFRTVSMVGTNPEASGDLSGSSGGFWAHSSNFENGDPLFAWSPPFY